MLAAILIFQTDGPLDFARRELLQAVAAVHAEIDPARISFSADAAIPAGTARVVRDGSALRIIGADATSAMYAALSAAKTLTLRGDAFFPRSTEYGPPYLNDRGWNLFLSLPWDYEHQRDDRDAAALSDPNRWWFLNDDYWHSLFDGMARARLNWLDLHGVYDIETTGFYNMYLYFADAPSFPKAGLPAKARRRNLAQLAHVIDMAHDRGVKVTLMSYASSTNLPAEKSSAATEDDEACYTREAVEAMVRALPRLDGIGYRIGETGRGADFYHCYAEAVANSGRDIPVLTRSWLTRKAQVVPLAQASSDFTVEIKYNGEQWALPYFAAGGRVPNWYSYSFEDYCSDSTALMRGRPPKTMWPGCAAEPGAEWPEQPYKIVWQVRANGTHRGVFPFYDPKRVAETVRSMAIGTATGFTVEPLNAYYPAEPRYYTAVAGDAPARWGHERDALYMQTWGRLGFDPETSVERFEAHMAPGGSSRAARVLARTWKSASLVIPTAFTAFSLGPDHRSHAPELEPGGDAYSFLERPGFDAFSVRTPQEEALYAAVGGVDGRWSRADVAELLETDAREIRRFLVPPWSEEFSDTPAARDVLRASRMLASLADYYADRFRGGSGADAWRELSSGADARKYRPFPERLRLGRTDFHWSLELPKVEAWAKASPRPYAFSPREPRAARFSFAEEMEKKLSIETDGSTVRVRVAQGDAKKTPLRSADLLVKPLASSTFFHRVPMEPDGRGGFQTVMTRSAGGSMLAVELNHSVRVPSAWRRASDAYFGVDDAAAPYRIVPAQPVPAPMYYASDEALAYLKPESIDPAKHGLIVVASRAWNFFRRFDAPQRRKLLDAVERGAKMLILQQDYASGRYALDFLPDAPRVASQASNTVPAAADLGVGAIEAPGILYQPFAAAPDWSILGGGAYAVRRYGRGAVYLCQARLQQSAHEPAAARALAELLQLDGRERPAILVDTGSESADDASPLIPDLLNALGVPFLTLGEVIAREQGPSAIDPIPGVPAENDVLGGRGPAMMQQFLPAKARAAASRPEPTTAAEFEAERARRKREIMRSLGLDPLPPRTPLEPRITGVLQRDGYRIEKLIFDSRPGFPVTAHLYIPDAPAGTRFPVILNPHGHWQGKKCEPVVQARLAAEAKAGYLGMVVDSPGNAFGANPDERAALGIHDQWKLLLGSANVTALYVWDLMRALDYLETRPEADVTRVGITGASGGGLATQWAFAADERLSVAVPVVYDSSFEIAPFIGCLCNHVPGSLQIGDRPDVLSVRAPAPIMIIGARDDGEFPPEGTLRSGEKLAAIYKLFGAEDRVRCRVFPGPHDYNQPMREAAIGFFDRYLQGAGDGSPHPEPELHLFPREAPELLCGMPDGRRKITMEDVARERLASARPRASTFEAFAELNGGVPPLAKPEVTVVAEKRETSGGMLQFVTVESEPGLRIPGLLRRPAGADPDALVLLLGEHGKSAADSDCGGAEQRALGRATLAIDVRGFGELAGLDPRIMAYLGTSDAFAMAVDAAQAARAAMRSYKKISIIGRGATPAQAALYAALMEPAIAEVSGLDGLESFADAFDADVPSRAVQPRADAAPPLELLRSLVTAKATWTFRRRSAPPHK